MDFNVLFVLCLFLVIVVVSVLYVCRRRMTFLKLLKVQPCVKKGITFNKFEP